ncbi:MAG: beta-ketoacyl-ACP synthase II [Thermoleophilia bacterium]|nr:beta-ketoacyl-ACP synthase II [Thermoleophilia bacterium]
MSDGNGAARIAVTGVGMVCPIGIGREATWTAALAGAPGAAPITGFDVSEYGAQFACEVHDFDPLEFVDRKSARRMDRCSQLAVAAARLALQDADLTISDADSTRAGAVVATGNGGNLSYEQQHRTFLERGADRVSPLTVSLIIGNMAAGHVSMQIGLRGPLLSVVTACASSLHAIGEAAEIIRAGEADVMLAGGSEAPVTPFGLGMLDASRAMSRRNDAPERASRPFDRDRDGFVLGEAGAILVLERWDRAIDRGAPILCEFAAYGATGDAHHVTEPSPDGAQQARAMRIAMAKGGLTPDDIDHVNAHATSTNVGDAAEVRSIITALGADRAGGVAVNATKSMHGHCIAGTGALESALTALAIHHGEIPGTINLENLDPECVGVDHVTASRKQSIDGALCSGFGFGGHNAVVALRKARG